MLGSALRATGRPIAGASSRSSPAGCPTAAATAWSAAPPASSTPSPVSRFDDETLQFLQDGRRHRRRDCRVPVVVPVRRRHRRLPRGRAVLPVLADPDRVGHLRRGGRARDAGALGAQPRLRHRLGRGAHGGRRRRPPDHRDGLAAHPRAGGGRRGPGGLPGRVRLDVEPRRRAAVTASRPPAPRRTPSPCCTTTSAPPSPRRSPRWATDTTLLVDTYDITRGIELAVEVAGSGPRRGPDRLRRPVGAGPARPRAARPPRRDRHADRGQRRPRRVRDRGAGGRAGRRLRRRDGGGHRLRRADRRPGLQAGRGGRPAGGQAVRAQGEPWRAQDGAAGLQAQRHGGRGDRGVRIRPARPARASGGCSERSSAPARWPASCRPSTSPASTCAPRPSPCPGTVSSSRAASRRYRPG